MGASTVDLGEWAVGETIRIRTNLTNGKKRTDPLFAYIPLDADTAEPVMDWRTQAGAKILASAETEVTDEPTGETWWTIETAGMPLGRVQADGWETLPSGDKRRVLIIVAMMVRAITNYPPVIP